MTAQEIKDQATKAGRHQQWAETYARVKALITEDMLTWRTEIVNGEIQLSATMVFLGKEYGKGIAFTDPADADHRRLKVLAGFQKMVAIAVAGDSPWTGEGKAL